MWQRKPPKYRLAAIQARMTTIEALRLTVRARVDIRNLGMTLQQALEVIQQLTVFDFHHTMACAHDPTTWQDVYWPEWKGVPLYVKFQEDRAMAGGPGSCTEDRCFVISFHERT
jgi:Motility quorum-sensing regulator, toxin of MqsA